MKIVTWNINGIRTFKGGVKKVLDLLDADIVCVQETKVTRDLLDEKTAIIDGYNSYFSFSRGRSGYSGVATFCRDSATPFAAEEGLTGLLTNKDGGLGCYGDQTNFTPEELQLLDNEGRAVLTQHRVRCGEQEETLTLINVYCPRADPDRPERGQFKLHFYNLLQLRAEAVLGAGSHVIVLGDFNTSHKPIDHCDPDEIENFEDSPSRRWLNGFLCGPLEEPAEAGETPQARGGFIDTFRHFHPSRHGAFTCWSTVTGARRTNYGTRIDYILASRALALLHFVEADISPEVEGSDHCPVWGHLCCELLPSPRCPPLCTRRMPEFTGRQQKLSRFLVKVEQPPETLPGSQDPLEVRENVCPDGNAAVKRKGATVQLSSSSSSSKAKKSKVAPDVPKPQGNLLSFFKPCPVPFVQPEDKSNAHNLVADNGSRPQSSTPAGAVPGFWKSLLRGPPQPPLCRTHQEPCVLRTVKKAGPNVGRQFFVCARPQGHASNPEARCDFFSWVEQDK